MRLLLAICAATCLLATAAVADPCEATLPRTEGQIFSGQVRYIGDGDSMCVTGRGGLVEVRLADFNAPERGQPGWRVAKDALRSVANGKWVVCTVTRGRNGRTISFDRVIATCRVGGRRLGDALRARRSPEGGY